MKYFFLSSFLFLASIIITAQNEIVLNFSHQVGTETLSLEQEYTHNDLGYEFSLRRVQYYISQIEILHDGGQSTSISDTWLLVNAFDNTDYSLGNQDIDSIEEIQFWIGVDPETNHLDPTIYPEGHALAMHNPIMHWGWAAGYRFAAIEGSSESTDYEIHGLGDINYHQVSLPTSSSVENDTRIITLGANYMGLFKDIDLSEGILIHGETDEAALLLSNFSTEVFSQLMFMGSHTLEKNTFDFYMAPNPATANQTKVYFNQTIPFPLKMQITDMSGRVIDELIIEAYQSVADLKIQQTGIYLLNILDGQRLLKTSKIVIN